MKLCLLVNIREVIIHNNFYCFILLFVLLFMKLEHDKLILLFAYAQHLFV